MTILFSEDQLQKGNTISIQNEGRPFLNFMNMVNVFNDLLNINVQNEDVNEENNQNQPILNQQRNQYYNQDEEILIAKKQIQKQREILQKQLSEAQVIRKKLQKQRYRLTIELNYFENGISQKQNNNYYYMKFLSAKIQPLSLQFKNKYQEQYKMIKYSMNLCQKLLQLDQKHIKILNYRKELQENRLIVSDFFLKYMSYNGDMLFHLLAIACFILVGYFGMKEKILSYLYLQLIILVYGTCSDMIKISSYKNSSSVNLQKYQFHPYNVFGSDYYYTKGIKISMFEFYLLRFIRKQVKRKNIKPKWLKMQGLQIIVCLILLTKLGIFTLWRIISEILLF